MILVTAINARYSPLWLCPTTVQHVLESWPLYGQLGALRTRVPIGGNLGFPSLCKSVSIVSLE